MTLRQLLHIGSRGLAIDIVTIFASERVLIGVGILGGRIFRQLWAYLRQWARRCRRFEGP